MDPTICCSFYIDYVIYTDYMCDTYLLYIFDFLLCNNPIILHLSHV